MLPRIAALTLLFACAADASEPVVPAGAADTPNAAQVALGRKLFFDRRLSFNGTVSCGMCHIPEQGFTHNELATPVGIEGRSVRRNAPSLYDVADRHTLFHDGRETSLELQVWSPLLAANEMGNPSIGFVLDRIAAAPDYATRFAAAFAERPNVHNLGQALAAYERTLLTNDSPFDRWYLRHESAALSADAERGFAVFRSKGCTGCHTVGADHTRFTDDLFHDTGIGYHAALGRSRDVSRLQVAPGVVIDVRSQLRAPVANDLGRYEITQAPVDRWKFRTPTLRNVALTAPYMHDGSLATLREVIAHYDAGGVPHDGQDPRIQPLALSQIEVSCLLAFLHSLTGANVSDLTRDARTAPVGDVGSVH